MPNLVGHRPPPPSPAGPLDPTRPTRGESSVALLRRNARTLCILCEQFGVEPSPEILERVASLYDRRPSWVTAESHPTDLLILYLAARGLTPGRVVEIGVASGLSTCALLAGLADAGVPSANPIDGREAVQSFDILEHVPWDHRRPIGSVIPVLVPELQAWSCVHTSCTSMDLQATLGESPVGLERFRFMSSAGWRMFGCAVLGEGVACAPGSGIEPGRKPGWPRRTHKTSGTVCSPPTTAA